MKKVLVVALLVVGLTTFAQGKREKMEPEERVEAVLEKMTRDLDLNEKQVAEIKSLLTNSAEERKNKHAEMKAKKETGEKPSKEEMCKFQ